MYTLELGIITAGFLFMCILVLGTTVFGRFFCSWACHIMVLQDLCAWALRKLGIRRKPIRSRLLLLVPPLTAFYMFLWPQLLRSWRSGALPEFHFRSDNEGWASFSTMDFWRNLPGPVIIVLTFLVCGFIIVYLLGSRTFCTYVCPYGAIFALADKFAPGRIRVSDACEQCGTCTAVCTSGIRVHDEVKQHGMIVSSACMKDLDCVGACPQQALSYSFGRPAALKSFKTGGRFGRIPYDFSLAEELLMAAVFIVVLLTFRGLYGVFPFLLTLALGGIIGYLSIMALRLVTRADVKLASLRLKTAGRFRPAAHGFTAFVTLLVAFVVHSAFVRYHEFSGLQSVASLQYHTDDAQRAETAKRSISHLATADRWGLVANPQGLRGLINSSLQLNQSDELHTYAARLLASRPRNMNIRLDLAQSYLSYGRFREAEEQYRFIVEQNRANQRIHPPIRASAHRGLGTLFERQRNYARAAVELRTARDLHPEDPAIHAQIGGVLAELGQFEAALEELREAVRLNPQLAGAQYNIGTILGRLGRFDESIPHYEAALSLTPSDAVIHNNLGLALLRLGRSERSREHLEQAPHCRAPRSTLCATAQCPTGAVATFRSARPTSDRL
jgi:tetratricopeptide (TPR) repeat protein/ferredoxin